MQRFKWPWISLWPDLMQANNQYHQICTHYQNITSTSTMVFTIIFGTHCNISLFCLFSWKFADLILFLFLKTTFVRPINRTIFKGFMCPRALDPNWTFNFSIPVLDIQKKILIVNHQPQNAPYKLPIKIWTLC